MSAFGAEPRDSHRPTPVEGRWRIPDGWLQSEAARLAAYLPFESLVVNKRVLDVAGVPAAKDRLRRARARTVMGAEAAPWDLLAQSVDVVMCLADQVRATEPFLVEVARVLAPSGMAVLRFPASTVPNSAHLAKLLGTVFPIVDLVGQVPIAGFTFDRGGSPGVVVAEDLFPMGSAPSHWLALCALGTARPWADLDSWLVPLARPTVGETVAVAAPDERCERADMELRLNELTREREYLRELLMTVQDDRDRLERLGANLRRDADRQLARQSEQGAALEVLTLERDQAVRRAAAAEGLRLSAPAPAGDFEPSKTSPTSA